MSPHNTPERRGRAGATRLPDASFAVRLGLVLRHARDSARLTLREAEEATGGALRASTISSYERGIRVVPTERLALLAETYGLSADVLTARARYEDPPTRAVIDLEALSAASEPQVADLVERVRQQRAFDEGRWLAIRMEDLRHAGRYDGPGDLENRLRSKGILVAMSPAPRAGVEPDGVARSGR